MIYELEDFYQYNNINIMSKYWKAILGAVVSAVIVSVLNYIGSLGDLWLINWHSLVNVAFLTFATSLLKFLGTTKAGKFAGVAPVK